MSGIYNFCDVPCESLHISGALNERDAIGIMASGAAIRCGIVSSNADKRGPLPVENRASVTSSLSRPPSPNLKWHLRPARGLIWHVRPSTPSAACTCFCLFDPNEPSPSLVLYLGSNDLERCFAFSETPRSQWHAFTQFEHVHESWRHSSPTSMASLPFTHWK